MEMVAVDNSDLPCDNGSYGESSGGFGLVQYNFFKYQRLGRR